MSDFDAFTFAAVAGSAVDKCAEQIDHEIGDRIGRRRRELGFSAATLGALIGKSAQTVTDYESGAERVGASRLKLIADALLASPAYFFGEDASVGAVRVVTTEALRPLDHLDGVVCDRSRQPLLDLLEAVAGNDDERVARELANVASLLNRKRVH